MLPLSGDVLTNEQTDQVLDTIRKGREALQGIRESLAMVAAGLSSIAGIHNILIARDLLAEMEAQIEDVAILLEAVRNTPGD
jgi:hypothetical protein